ncbi:GNAT family N-acetyltransferase [Alkalihalophilus marmarensis]|jgi:RimJ/RimL family protein N-acetyltransferase|uniref:N-acetyltransferase domain-containing protein n=1 Tax=Alkalihalophilus marmarensis DSM 21297 TaxID=1188261 RepID=U6SQA2_9BACI|nr:GNAT family protein [Alkalihalophilus marmarensis]ERN53808.1 hypothetical protein A33I_10030 [Alkalihalophilus marmarensis DSM 21297]MCM3490674.1 GNAT family N-acetyltransferase [Alkalihalophilus marmarensis]
MNTAPTIHGENVLLRQPIESDLRDYMNVEEDNELKKMYGIEAVDITPKTFERAKRFIEAIANNQWEWCVVYQNRFVGQARLTVNQTDNRARYAVGLFDPSVWNKGLGTEVTNLVLEFAFKTLNLHRVDLRVLEYNVRAIRCYEKCGFIKEGIEREGALINGKYETDLFMSILDREYEEK